MALNQTPASERVHIGIFGKRNAGKSSLINAMTGQNLAIVADVPGTTTDPVFKTMELLPIGPVMMIDTPGIDDEGELGALRVKKSYQVLNKTDIALLVVDGVELTQAEEDLLVQIKAREIPYVIAFNKADKYPDFVPQMEHAISVSAAEGINIWELKELIAAHYKEDESKTKLIQDLISPGDQVVLVVPIDKAAPKGRLILPQQQTIRDILDGDAVSVVVKETQLEETLARMAKPPKLVVTDSQAFAFVSKVVPQAVPLTSFSILMARYKGVLEQAVSGVQALKRLKDGEKVLISEGCTHHRQCDDIGTVKLPRWIREFTGKELEFCFSSGTEFPEDLTEYAFVLHCGGCMLNDREMQYRMRTAKHLGVPMSNYGITIAYMQGILQRSVAMLPEIPPMED